MVIAAGIYTVLCWEWLKHVVCFNHSQPNTVYTLCVLHDQVCRYSDWTRPIIVDMTDLARCAELDPFNFTSRVCANGDVLQNLLANLDNTRLLKHCLNGSTGGTPLGFNPAKQCQYASWGLALPDQYLMALCWDYDQANFASLVCLDVGLLSRLAQAPSTLWVSRLCNDFTNHSSNVSSSADAQPCLARDLVKRFNWSCSANLAPVCRPGAGVTASLQAVLRCWVESLMQRMQGLPALSQAGSVSVVLLVALEERQLTSLRVTENIRLSVLKSIGLYLERENNFENKRVLLQCFGVGLGCARIHAHTAVRSNEGCKSCNFANYCVFVCMVFLVFLRRKY